MGRLYGGRAWATIGAVSAGIAVAAGAFGAHALRARVDARALEVWETAARCRGAPQARPSGVAGDFAGG